jgi:membrane-bound lytic murein transglycosylase D
MSRKLLILLTFIAVPLMVFAQITSNGSDVDLRLPYEAPVQVAAPQQYVQADPVVLEEYEKELLQRLSSIYRMHVLSLDAQANDDLISAERYITDGLTQIQNILDENPEAQSNRRLAELYRTVMTEYQMFYGIKEPVREGYGEIYAVLREMFTLEDDLFETDYFVLPAGIAERKTDVPLILNRQVQNQINYLAYRRPEIMTRWLERSAIYFPMMRRIFEEEGVPLELIHLSMVESGLVPVAQSHARAVGMWQFMYATGAHYGLEANWWLDERRDPEKATRAAARHLRDLHEYWGDWHLALANYNVSTRRMRSSIQLAGGVRDYWAIFPYLPRETRGYVPSFIAATIIATNPQEFGFDPKFDATPYQFDVVEIEGSVDLSVLAELAGITTQELKFLNPELLRWATPPGPRPYPLKIPINTKAEFAEKLKDLPETARRELIVHTVSRGESLGLIANRYSVTVRDLYASNERLSTTIHPGQEIVIPVPEGTNIAISATNPSRARTASTASAATSRTSTTTASPATPPNSARLTYTVKSGDTVGHIAEWYGTQAWRVRSWNGTTDNIRVGQRMVIFVPASRQADFANINNMSFNQKQAMVRDRRAGRTTNVASASSTGPETYTVKRNDNLWDIAQAHGTTVDRIKQLNNLSTERINVGQVLRVR